MITLKSKIVKRDFMENANYCGNIRYRYTQHPIEQRQAFMEGVKYTIEQLKFNN